LTDPLKNRSIREIASGIRDGSTTVEALITGAAANHRKHGEALGAYKHWDEDRALGEARAIAEMIRAGRDAGPMMGMPVSVKDIYGVRAMPTFAGTPKELPEAWRAEGPVVAALRRDLAVAMGKTHTVEFAFGAVGATGNWPSPRNPWDADNHRACGGSSVGAGVSLAEGSAVVALGTDTGGSVRIPASVTGQVGLKTTIGRWSTAGIVPLSSSFDTPGPLTRTVEDAIMAFAAIDPAWDDADALFRQAGGLDASDLRIGIPEELFWDDCSPGVAEGVKGAIDELAAKGAKIKSFALPEASAAREGSIRGGLFGVEGLSFMDEFYPDRAETMDPNVGFRFQPSRDIDAITYFTEMRKIAALAAAVDERLKSVDVLVTPTVPLTPPTIEEVSTIKGYSRANAMMARNAQPVNLLALSAITMPIALDGAKMPVGLQVIARGRQEELLLAAAWAIERALGTGRDRLGEPPLCRD
jgi:aspartyl-tRNA(Asn)/glutamyl-tRNA(Gln) amidotransferase subunit A